MQKRRVVKVTAVIVAVNYLDFLKISLPNNKRILDRIIIVTSKEDIETQKFCKEQNVECIATNIFYEKGKFNKFAGINEALKLLNNEWVLFLDADIVLHPICKRVFQELKFEVYELYGADRFNCIGIENWEKFSFNKQVIDNWLMTSCGLEFGARINHYYGQEGENGKFSGYKPLGFFQLAHKSYFKNYPEYCPGADHCDIEFANLYTREQRVLIPEIPLIHLVSKNSGWGSNWKGRTTLPFDFREKSKLNLILSETWCRIKGFFKIISKYFPSDSN